MSEVLTVAEVSRRTGLSDRTLRRILLAEPGVIILERPGKMNKRRYRTVRVPHTVLERVMRRLTKLPQ